jgi:hypothetical protein
LPELQKDTTMSIRVGIVGISGFGGGEAMRLVAGHPAAVWGTASPVCRPSWPNW